jgi:hypothetical protein
MTRGSGIGPERCGLTRRRVLAAVILPVSTLALLSACAGTTA